jgi:hypothetical protein
MIKDTITHIEEKLAKDTSVAPQDKEELLRLLKVLSSEVDELAKTHAEHAESIGHFARASAHEATRKKKDPQLLKLSLKGLSSSTEGFEVSHPRLVEIVNRISYVLANMGI